MILDDFLILDNVGLYCSYGDFYLDPKQGVKTAVISHAHADHAVRGNQQVYCTEATSLFMLHRYKKNAAEQFFLKKYHEKFTIKDIEISFISAGHMLGSAMVMMVYKGIKYLYTGDYKTDTDESCAPFEFLKADVLITETTFANPNTKHPNAAQEIKKLNETESNIMLGAYALGKSQRLIDLINKHCPEKRILIHFSILPFVKIYEENGFNLGKYEVYDRKVMKNTAKNLIYIVPPMAFNSYHRAINVIRVFATGWTKLQEGNGIKLYVSDHADWDSILETIKNVAPSQVWTLHGDGKQLKEYVEKTGTLVKNLN
ncbi:MAG: exonuclease [Sphingobacteriaceae bacterium]|nr:exonuclease [Sphingobacteriaceae bacterium]